MTDAKQLLIPLGALLPANVAQLVFFQHLEDWVDQGMRWFEFTYQASLSVCFAGPCA